MALCHKDAQTKAIPEDHSFESRIILHDNGPRSRHLEASLRLMVIQAGCPMLTKSFSPIRARCASALL